MANYPRNFTRKLIVHGITNDMLIIMSSMDVVQGGYFSMM